MAVMNNEFVVLIYNSKEEYCSISIYLPSDRGLLLEERICSLSCKSMDGWMTCDLTSFLTVFQSYQDDVWVIMKGCVKWNSVYD